MFRYLALLLVLGFCLGAGTGCSLRPATAPPARPISTSNGAAFAVESEKRGQWQAVATYANEADARGRVEQMRRANWFASVRIRVVQGDLLTTNLNLKT